MCRDTWTSGQEGHHPFTHLPHLPCLNTLLTSLRHGIIPSLHSSCMEKTKSYSALIRTFFASRSCKVAMQRVGSFEHVLLTRHNTTINSCSKCNLGLELLPFGSHMESPWQLFHWEQHGYTGKYCNLEKNFGMEISFGNEVLCETIDSLFDKMLENAPTPKRSSSWDQQVCENAESYM